MNQNKFEKQISDKLNGYEVQPSEGLFDTLMETRAKKSKSFAFKSFKMVAVLLGFLTVTLLLIWVSNSNQKNQNLVLLDETPNQQTKSSLTDENQNVKSETPKVETQESPLVLEKESNNNESQVTKQKPRLRKSLNKNQFVQNNSNLELPLMISKNKKSNNQLLSDDGSDIYNRYFDANSKNKPQISYSEHNKNAHLYVFDTEDPVLVDKATFKHNWFVKFKSFKNKMNIEQISLVKNEKVKIKTQKGQKPIWIDVYNSSIVSKSHAIKSPNAVDLNGLSINVYNNAFGFRINKPLKNQWSLFSGLNYLNQTSHFKGSLSEFKSEQKITKISSYINDPVRGVVLVETFDTQNLTRNIKHPIDLKNTYSIFQLPIGLSYNVGYKNFEFAINSSALLNLVSMSKGNTLNAFNYSDSRFNSGKKYLNVGFGIGLGSTYKLSPKFKLLIEPGLQIFNVSSLKAGNNINERLFNKQLSVGVRYSIF